MSEKISVQKFLKLTSLFTFLVGVAMIAQPVRLVDIFTGAAAGPAKVFVMFLGSALLGISVLDWLASKVSDKRALNTILAGNLASLATSFPLSLYGLASGNLNACGWLIALVHFSFGAGFYYYLRRAHS